MTILARGALSAALLYANVYKQISGDYTSALSLITELREFLLQRTLFTGLGTGLFIIIAVSMLNLFYSHRVAPFFASAGRLRG